MAALVAAHIAARWPAAAVPIAAAALLLAAAAGLTFPDLDQPLPLLDHRSALTHSIAPALAALWRRWLRPLAAGLALGIALHLAADCFPHAMIGYATVKLPFTGSLGGWSYAWLAANAAACGWLFGALLRGDPSSGPARPVILVAGGLLGLSYLSRVDGGYLALATLLALAWTGWRIGRPAAR